MSALGNHVRQQYSKSEDHEDSNIKDIMEEVCLYYFSLTLCSIDLECRIAQYLICTTTEHMAYKARDHVIHYHI